MRIDIDISPSYFHHVKIVIFVSRGGGFTRDPTEFKSRLYK